MTGASYSEFAPTLLVAAYHEVGNRDFPEINAGDLLDAYDLGENPGWVRAAIDEFSTQGFMEDDPTVGGDRGLSIMLKGPGLREAERLIASGLKVPRRHSRSEADATWLPIDQFPSEERDAFSVPDQPASPGIQVDSASWTGRVVSEAQRIELVSNIDSALLGLDNLNISNDRKAQGRAFLLAARELAEAPDPPFDLIQLLLRHFDRTIGIAGLLLGFASLMLAV